MSMTGEPESASRRPRRMAVLIDAAADRPRRRTSTRPRDAVWSWHSKKYGDVAPDPGALRPQLRPPFYPEGAPRQLAAIYASGPRPTPSPTVDVPTLVIHGRDDTLITPGGGVRTAELIPGANLLLVADMGHDLPEPLWPLLIDAILGFTATATPTHRDRRRRTAGGRAGHGAGVDERRAHGWTPRRVSASSRSPASARARSRR